MSNWTTDRSYIGPDDPWWKVPWDEFTDEEKEYYSTRTTLFNGLLGEGVSSPMTWWSFKSEFLEDDSPYDLVEEKELEDGRRFYKYELDESSRGTNRLKTDREPHFYEFIISSKLADMTDEELEEKCFEEQERLIKNSHIR